MCAGIEINVFHSSFSSCRTVQRHSLSTKCFVLALIVSFFDVVQWDGVQEIIICCFFDDKLFNNTLAR